MVNDVKTVLDKVLETDSLITPFIQSSLLSCMPSLILSKIIIVSFKEYPIIVKTAAKVSKFTSIYNKEIKPRTTKISCTSERTAARANLHSNLTPR